MQITSNKFRFIYFIQFFFLFWHYLYNFLSKKYLMNLITLMFKEKEHNNFLIFITNFLNQL